MNLPLWLRLGLSLAVVVLAMRMLSFLAFNLILEDRLRAGLTYEMRVHAAEMDAISHIDGNGKLTLRGVFSDPRYRRPGSGFYWQVNVPGQEPLRSGSLADRELAVPESPPPDASGVYTVASPDGPAMMVERVRTLPDGRTMRIALATSEAVLYRELRAIETPRMVIAIFWSFLLVPVVLMMLWVVSSPLRQLRREIGDLDGGRADRISGDYPSDIQPVADKLNTVLEGYRNLANHTRLQAASLAHNVRSVMVSVTDEVERLEKRHPSEPAFLAIKQSCKAIQRYIESHARRIDRLRESSIDHETGLVEELIEYCFDAAQRLHREKRLEWHLAAAPDCEVRCSRRDLGEMLFSLLDNAGRWARHAVHCRWRIEGDCCLIEIDDDGPGFDSGDDAKQAPEGLGLGLEIARELAAAHGGSIETGVSPTGGARLTVRLPRA